MGNIHDIARMAGVSAATVSRVLNNHPYVKEEKRRAVVEAAEQLRYVKNINAVHLSLGKTKIIGVILPFVSHPYFGVILGGIASAAEKSGYKLMITQSNYQVSQEIEALDMLKRKQVDGVIIVSRECPIDIVKDYSEYGQIVLCEALADPSLSSVFVDQYKAFQAALSFLKKKGHQKVGYTLLRTEGKSSLARKQAYEEQYGKAKRGWVFNQALTIDDGIRIAGEWAALSERPDAMVITNDFVAAGFLLECRRLGFSVPEDAALIGFDNHPIAGALGITTVELPLHLLGEIAFEQVISSDTSHKEVPFRLIERDSV
ncbi:LacI family DNA-binding transcriptional regulator [Domibacillus sp. DTU_2020_1001157_1_SI_ALB_TIR_016]|uniref:LacI family DNA-binding transcriptional regulator n=1 Tax=Domibacillus sp. DTU_2020_1001157_1_SI_ALB_TIR_016 TaxID=3077789 RepID=UPI0028E4CB49|nr:LacI family DNA-binding transcriptional regulator [Domibacillus sp. DTU_2020_1001157_1_SI_ALB_TIR_016]WNS80468.1 LacI family DNA-binding transcriptional regulator [Domibacillus sp. DTU_2020_1001157_1_SI_ALB_TIR_016]